MSLGFITDVDLDNNYIYVKMVQGTLALGDFVGDYGAIGGDFPVGYATISTIVTNAGAATGLIQNIQTIGGNKRIYLETDIRGTFSKEMQSLDLMVISLLFWIVIFLRREIQNSLEDLMAQHKLQTYHCKRHSLLPDPAGHMLILFNGILQPPGATNAFTAFSDQIQFTEAPDLGASLQDSMLVNLDNSMISVSSLTPYVSRSTLSVMMCSIHSRLRMAFSPQQLDPRTTLLFLSMVLFRNLVLVLKLLVLESSSLKFLALVLHSSHSLMLVLKQTLMLLKLFLRLNLVTSLTFKVGTSDTIIESSNSLITFDYLGSVFGRDASATPTLTSQFIESSTSYCRWIWICI